ncbi:two component LuxR family transcriptional regulator, partial [Streptomyces sp. KO7888]|nr:two component LuxR family transcriptional regulator [Streptomyces sp. KO7888]
MGEDGGLDAVGAAGAGEDAADVRLDRTGAQIQPLGDLPVGQTGAEQPQHVPLGRGQPVDPEQRRLGVPAGPHMPLEQPPGDPRGQHGLALGCESDGPDQVGGAGVLEEEAAGPGPQGPRHVGVLPEGRQHHDTGARRETGDVLGRGDTVPDRHLDVHQGDVDVLFATDRGGFPAVACLGDHLDVVGVLQDEPDSGAHQRLVVGDQDSDHRLILGPPAVRSPAL